MKEKIFLLLTLTFLTLITILKQTLQFTDDSICPSLKCSSSGICVDNYSQCPTPMNCGNDLKKVNQYTCAKSETNFELKKCKKYTCWNNECVNDTKLCPTMSSCPSKALVKCHDNSCVDNLSNCPKYITCPKFIPIRCPNGDCRRNLEDCPSLVKCPKDFPILCNDNSCRITAEECEKPAENTKCSGSSMVRCADGTCKSSKFLCATAKTCPIGKVLCFSGICAESHAQCEKAYLPDRSNTCGSKGIVRCDADGSCRNDINDCPTAVICPVEKPVKCWDNSCKENIYNCPDHQACPKNRMECANGACKIALKSCGALITCSWDAPFKCKDNTCKRNPNDCSNSDECPAKKPILCWDGSCVANRIDCIVPEDCPISMSVRCPDNQCRKSVEECKEITGCPVGFIRCADLTCKRKSSDCKEATCPLNFANLCSNGVCVKDVNDCENGLNGCPFYAKEKCKSGKCVSDKSLCEDIKVESADLQLCADGSQILKGLSCPLPNGCPSNKPLLCGNGECRASCKIATCPKETPVKCLNGLCVISESNCPSNYNFNSVKECAENNLITCANGRCARFPEECKPTSACPKDMIKCGDGTCRFNAAECPKHASCPEAKFRCLNGACENSENDCLNISGCPKNRKIKCVSNGLCVETQEDCATYDKKFALANGCDIDKPFKCLNSGKCAVDKDSCEESLCEGKKIFCPNSGVCKDSMQECKKSTCDGVTCPTNGLCVKKIEECKTLKGCDPKTPYRCLDGQCRKYPFSFGSRSESQFCSLRIECPSYRPYLCADGSCMEKSSFCKSLAECPADAKVRCPDRTCAKSLEECSKFAVSANCPATNPILCSNNGNCVKNYFDCFEEKCAEELPFKCVNGICVSSPRECVYEMNLISKSNNGTNTDNFSLTLKTKCESADKTCFDGSCRDDIRLCPVYDGCNNLDFPYKCASGKCAKDRKGCLLDSYLNPIIFSELANVKCQNNSNLCDDGICRTVCPASNSCDNTNPYLCSNGRCVNDINECAGESKCEIGNPFRCVDGICVSEPALCRKPKKLESSTDLKLFVFPEQDLIADIVIDDSNDIIGSIYIPSKAFKESEALTNNQTKNKNNSNNTNISNDTNAQNTDTIGKPSKQIMSIRSLAFRDPKFKNTTKNFTESARDIVNKLFPYGDEKDQLKLEFEYAVLSPVLKINFEIENSVPKQDLILNLAFDLQNYQMYSGKILQRVCLAYLQFANSTEWSCTKKIDEEDQANQGKIEGVVLKPGYYAIALDLVIDEEMKSNEQVWIMKNLKWFIMIICTCVFLVFLFIYIFLRILRYRTKYIKTKIDYIEMEKKEAGIKEKSTNFKGQTIRDSEENMVFTDNPCKQEQLNQNNESKKVRMDYLKSVEDTYFHKIKVSESNCDKLNKELDSAYERYEKLKEYAELLRQGKNLFSEAE